MSEETKEYDRLGTARRLGARGEFEAEEKAVNAALEAEPYSIPATIAKGDCRARAGDNELAAFFYRQARAFGRARRLSSDETRALEHAGSRLRSIEENGAAAREARLAERGLPPASWSPRLRHALDLAAGKRRPYAQRPTSFFYPELPQVQFYDPGQFAWAATIENAAADIAAELAALLREGTDGFRPYIQSDVASVPGEANAALLGKKDWSVLALCENGWLSPDLIRRCPRTWEAVLQAPVPRVSGWGPTITFSLLKAGAHIAAHTGMVNTRLICHLPLIVPPGCRFRVGNELREWQVGKLLIFDDTIEHEAWNDGGEDRVVLIFDIWRPELSERERHELTALFSD